jgi:hypothetical protein
LRRGDEFQQFLRIIEPLLKIVLVFAEGSGRKLRGNAGVFQARIRRDETDLVQTNALRACKRGLQLYGKFGGFCFAGWKGAGKTANFLLCDGGEKLNAGKAGSGEQLSELFFCGSAFQGNAIQQQLRAGGTEHQPVVRTCGNCRAELVPGDVQLFGGTGVLETVQTGKLQEYVKASYEGPSRSRLRIR